MLDFIRYLPLAWRTKQSYCTPRGPRIARAQLQTLVIGGSRLSIRAPRHSPLNSDYGQVRPGSDDALLRDIAVTYSPGDMANEHWGFRSLFGRSWAFWGPWMTGEKVQLTLRVTLVGRTEKYDYGRDISYFHPRAFENALADHLNARYGHLGWNPERPRYVGPINWQRQTRLPVFSATFDIYRRDSDSRHPDSLHEKFLVFPITHNRFIEVTLARSLLQQADFYTTPVSDLEEAILNSLQLELSPSTQADWDNARARFGNVSLSTEFPPLRWPIVASSPTPMH